LAIFEPKYAKYADYQVLTNFVFTLNGWQTPISVIVSGTK